MFMDLASFPQKRATRLRRSPAIRDLVCETKLSVADLIYPLFIKDDAKEKIAISSMPGQYQHSLESLKYELDKISSLSIKAVILFGVTSQKYHDCKQAFGENSIVSQAVKYIKKHYPHLIVITDLCFCDYSSHGHCYFVDEKNNIDSVATLANLQKMALEHAQAGADVVAPSGMVDGMVSCIRNSLDENKYSAVLIMSYAAKFSSSLYGPFRDAVECSTSFGNRDKYQINPANKKEALAEVLLDSKEGADIVMVKPASFYLDIISQVKEKTLLPVAAYQVSGEYSMIHAAGEKGWIDLQKCALESLLCIKRAGADMIISYFAKEIAAIL